MRIACQIFSVTLQRKGIGDPAPIAGLAQHRTVVIAFKGVVVADLAEIDRVLRQPLREQRDTRIEGLREHFLAPECITNDDADIAGTGHRGQSINDERPGRQLAARHQLIVDEDVHRRGDGRGARRGQQRCCQ